MPPGFAKLDRELLGRLTNGTAAVRELSERPRLHTRIIPLQSFYASRNTIALRRLFAEGLLGRFCARLEVARERAAAGRFREAGIAYQGLLLASQILQLEVALLQMAVYADEAGQPVAQIQQMAIRPLAQLQPLLEASLTDDPRRVAAEIPAAVEHYNASVASLKVWATNLKLGTERVKVARVLWDTLLISVVAVEAAAVMAEMAAAASTGPPAAMAALAGSAGAAELVMNRALVLEIAGALETLIAVGAMDSVVVVGLHAMASGTSVPPEVRWPSSLEQAAVNSAGPLGAPVSPAFKVTRVVNSNMPHAAERAVERAGFATEKSAREALQQLGRQIEKVGLPQGTIWDTARADRVIVPGFGQGGAVVYQVSEGTLKLKTVLEWVTP